MSNQINLETAVLRIARAGIKQANAGDIAGGQALVKVANALAEGHRQPEILKAYFAPETHQKIAQVLDNIVSQPSDVAQIVTMQKKAQAFDKLAETKKKVKK